MYNIDSSCSTINLLNSCPLVRLSKDLYPEPPVLSSEMLSKYQCIAKNIIRSQSTSIYFAFARPKTVTTRHPTQSIAPSNVDSNEIGITEKDSTVDVTGKEALSKRPSGVLDGFDISKVSKRSTHSEQCNGQILRTTT